MIDVMTVKRLATQFGLSDLLECEYSNIGRADNLNKFANAVAAHQRDIDASICFAESEKAFKLKGTSNWSPYIEGMSDGADECGELIKMQGKLKLTRHHDSTTRFLVRES